ncbi:MORN repeat variant [Vibrio xiamenensis]|uniref:MORN repeat variant n=1 Tax=Vibrio xiamenensis TaxID=861298 RepID=A0A1G8HHK2_9VIBR|nr:hypothetical protein [Vibrio xiamenensis]SDI06128.1 MORN repeat variant [Vibrio xiamenensis]
MSPKLKWTIRGRIEIVYTGTLKEMKKYTGHARLYSKNDLYAEGECTEGVKVGFWTYYQSNDQVMLEETYDDKGRKQGISRSFYENGQISAEGFYIAGQLHGESRTWYDNGALESHNLYDKGKPVEVKTFYLEGEIRLHQEFISGRLNKETWYKQDASIWRYQEYENGKVIKEINSNY